jgi:hypothetical protein
VVTLGIRWAGVRHVSVSSSSIRVIFLGGLGRSGTTLLERLLGEVPGVVPLGEVVHLWARGVIAGEPCGCGDAFADCPFWHEVGRRAFRGWSPGLAERMLWLRQRVDRTRRIPALAFRTGRDHELAEYVARYRRLYTAAAEVAGCPFVIDSSKHASLAFCLVAAGVDVHVVHVVRDPRAVAHSWQRPVERPEDGRLMTQWPPVRTALHWSAQNLALEFLSTCGIRVTRVRYEDLLDEPGRTLGELARRLRLGAPPGCLTERGARLSVAHTVSGNPVRFATGPLRLARDDRWRADLPRPHHRLVTALTWPLMLRYGYRESAA